MVGGPAPLEPVDAFAHQVELDRVAARCVGRGDLDSHVRLAAGFEGVRQPRARVVAVDERAVGRAQLRAEPDEPPAVARLAGNGRVDRLCTRVRTCSGRPGRPDERQARAAASARRCAARGVAPGMALPRPLSSHTSCRMRSNSGVPGTNRRE